MEKQANKQAKATKATKAHKKRLTAYFAERDYILCMQFEQMLYNKQYSK